MAPGPTVAPVRKIALQWVSNAALIWRSGNPLRRSSIALISACGPGKPIADWLSLR